MQALFVDNLTVIDFAYFDPARGIVGESLILDVTLYGDLNDEGMLFDFSFVKKRIKSCVDELVDHKFLVAENNNNVKVEKGLNELDLTLTSEDGHHFRHISPYQAVCLVKAEAVTPQSIIDTINQEVFKILPENVTKLEMSLRAEEISGDYYHYAHGLKKHLGDCQRIAHGHRSKIEVWENDQLSHQWMSHIAELWKDIYLATEEDIIDKSDIDGVACYTFQYHANQGKFKLIIPQSKCHIINTDTTVELIAVYLADYLKQQSPNARFKVKAYEGVDKGAIAIV